jgi:4-hydroxybenzoate polyprenyltransferase
MLIASRWMISVHEILILVSAVSLIALAVYFYNDIKDFDDDLKIAELGNKLKSLRPLGQGRITKDLFTKFTVISALLGLLFASLLNIWALVSLSLYLILGLLYSTEPFRLKKYFISKQLVIAFGCAIAVLAGGFAGGEISSLVIFMVSMDFAIAVGVSPVMDLPDLQGDKVMGVKTMPVIIGPSMAVRFAIAVLGGIIVSSIIGYISLGLNIALPFLITLVAGAWIYTIMPLMRRYNDIAFTNIVCFKRVVPLYFIIQLVPLAGILL